MVLCVGSLVGMAGASGLVADWGRRDSTPWVRLNNAKGACVLCLVLALVSGVGGFAVWVNASQSERDARDAAARKLRMEIDAKQHSDDLRRARMNDW